MQRAPRTAVRCAARSLRCSAPARCYQRPSNAHRVAISETPVRARPSTIAPPRCRYSDSSSDKPQKGEEKPKPAPRPDPRAEMVERMLQEEREAILSRTSRRDTSRNVAPIGWWSVAFLAALAAAVTFLLGEEEKQRKRSRQSVGAPKIGGSWTLVDMNGVPRTDHEFRGQFQLVYFGFTYCPDICPVELKKICDVIDVVDAEGLGKYLQPLFITVDPQRDTVYQIREYLKEFHPRLLGLTGTPEQLRNCARAFRVYSMPGLEADVGSPDYLVDHSVIIYLMGPDNKLVEYFGSRQSAQDIAKRVSAHLKAVAPRSVVQRVVDGFQGLFDK